VDPVIITLEVKLDNGVDRPIFFDITPEAPDVGTWYTNILAGYTLSLTWTAYYAPVTTDTGAALVATGSMLRQLGLVHYSLDMDGGTLTPVQLAAVTKYTKELPSNDNVAVGTQVDRELRVDIHDIQPRHGQTVVPRLNVQNGGRLLMDLYTSQSSNARTATWKYFKGRTSSRQFTLMFDTVEPYSPAFDGQLRIMSSYTAGGASHVPAPRAPPGAHSVRRPLLSHTAPFACACYPVYRPNRLPRYCQQHNAHRHQQQPHGLRRSQRILGGLRRRQCAFCTFEPSIFLSSRSYLIRGYMPGSWQCHTLMFNHLLASDTTIRPPSPLTPITIRSRPLRGSRWRYALCAPATR